VIDLPAGYRAQPLADADVDAVVALVRVCEEHDGGTPMLQRADLVSDLVGVDRTRCSVVVREAGADPAGPPVAWGMVLRRRSRWADVHPGHRGRGIGRALVAWSLAAAAAEGADRVGQTIEDGRADAEQLFASMGAVPVRTSWILHRDIDPAGPRPVLSEAAAPEGIELGASRPAEQDAALDLMEAAFATWPDRMPSTRQTWQALVTQREGFRDEHLQVAVDRSGVVVGAMVLLVDDSELWVDKLATHPDHWGRGIGRALLAHAFGHAHDRGLERVALSTDSTTGALPFYECLGMRVVRSFTHWATPLAPAAGGPVR
jgi:GNAT superfamily N-acetyltransferase